MFGRREEVTMSIVNYFDNIRRNIHFYLNWFASSDLRKEMSRNKIFRNKHKNERCFIIGNGPSLKHYDLCKLTNEKVFTVNYMMKSNLFKILNPNYHLFVDPIVFNVNSTKKEDLENLELVNTTKTSHPDLTYFIPYRRREGFIRKFPYHKFNFIYNYKTFTPQMKEPSALHRNTPGFQNVIIYAINTAMYMGFTEIYLLGVDMTGFIEHFEYKKTNDQFGHSYSKTEEEKQVIKNNLKERNIDNEFYLKAFGRIFEHFKLINKFAIKKNVRLINASSHGGLDVLERVSFDEIKF